MLAFLKGLGVGILCLLVFVVGVIFNEEFLNKNGKESGLKLSRDIEVYTELKPDRFVANINFWANQTLSTKLNLSQEEKAAITDTFGQVIERSKKENFCSGGSFSLNPNFSYQEGVQIPKGMRLDANLKCEFKTEDLNVFNALLSDINAIVDKSEFVAVSTPSLEAVFSNELLKTNKEKLYDELIKKAYVYSENYSKNLNKTCILKNLEFLPQSSSPIRALSVKADTNALSLPLIQEEQVNVKAKAEFICN